jgi:hypothetical protein
VNSSYIENVPYSVGKAFSMKNREEVTINLSSIASDVLKRQTFYPLFQISDKNLFESALSGY